LTNTLDINQPIGEMSPIDNRAYAVLTTGPDLYVTKTADRATVKRDEVVTFTLSFGNQAQRNLDNTAGRVLLIDTLPAGLTFGAATQHDCPTCTLDPLINGQQLIFDFDPMSNGQWYMIDVTASVTSTARMGDVFVNQASISSNNSADVDPITSNNSASSAITVKIYRVLLPLVRKG
jgi:uncharacterized repeat protein (TIGR01451 family)